jgi:hypothetical protein
MSTTGIAYFSRRSLIRQHRRYDVSDSIANVIVFRTRTVGDLKPFR